jgi:hypothetical protein
MVYLHGARATVGAWLEIRSVSRDRTGGVDHTVRVEQRELLNNERALPVFSGKDVLKSHPSACLKHLQILRLKSFSL